MTTKHSPLWRHLAQALAGSQAVSQGKAMVHTGTARPALASAMRPLALEQRFMFDGAGAADAAHAVADGAIPSDAADATADTTSALRHALMAEAPAASRPRLEVVFVDDQVQDYQQLIAGLRPDVEVMVLDGSRDGLQQMADHLAGRTGIDAIHVLSHGLQGQVTLGAVTLDSSSLSAYAETLARVGGSLSESGDILLYGCDVGRDASGQAFIGRLAQLTQADVAASTDATGASARGGNWVLEANHGLIDTALPLSADAQEQFAGRLFSGTITFSGPDASLGTSVTDGEGNSTDISGVVIELYAADASGANVNHAWMNNSNYFSMGAGVSTEQHEGYLVLRSSSSENFSFRGIQLAEAGVQGGSYTFTAYRDGNNVGSVTLAIDASDFISTYGASDFSANKFGNVDEIRIGMPANSQVAVNNIVIADPTEPPSISGLNGDSVAWAGVGNTVTLDSGGNATFNDADFGALNSGDGNWQGATLTVQNSGTAVSTDIFGFNTVGAIFTISGNTLQSGGQTFATFTSTGGVLTISFTSSGTTATTALVNDVARHITYRSDTPAGDAAIRFSMTDGTSTATANTTVASDTIYVTKTTDTATIDRTNGVSFSEAVAIAAADVTGTQTIVFASNLAGQALNLNTVSLNESLIFDMTQANGLTLSDGTITLAGGTTQVFNVGFGNSATISSLVAGSGALTKAGAGNLTLAGAGNTYSGATSISAGTLTASGGDALSTSTSVSVAAGATLALAGSETLGNISGAGSVALGSFILTSTQTADTTFSGTLSGSGGVTFNQAGAATYATTLSGTNTYTGATVLANYGWLKLGGDASMSNSSAVRVNDNGTLTLLSDQTIGSLASNSANARIQLGSYTLTAGGDHSSTSVSGVVSGTGSLDKQGSGTWTLGAANIYSGTTTVSGGTLSIASDGNLGADTVTLAAGTVLAVTGATTIDNAIVLSGNATVSNLASATLSGGISGAHTLTKSGSGTLTLSGTNSYSDTTVNAGTLSVADDANLGSGVLTLDGATFNVTTNSSTIDNAIVIESGGGTFNKASGTLTLSGSLNGVGSITKTGNGQLTHTGSGTLTLDGANITTSSGSGAMTLRSNIVLGNSGGIFNVTGGDITLNGDISGSGSLTRQGGASYLWLAGNNSHTGTQFVTSGWLVAASATAFGTGQIILSDNTTLGFNSGIASFANNIVLADNVTLQNANPNNTVTTLTGVISESGGSRNLIVKGGSGTNNAVVLAGNNTYTGTTTLATGTLKITNADNISSAGITLGSSGANFNISGSNVTLSNNINLTGSATISNDNAVTLSGVISGNTTLAKSGIGTLTLSGSNTNTGTTTVSAGTLVVDGSTSSATNVSSGATLAGSGTLGGNVTVQNGGTLSPGDAGVSTLTVNGNLNLNSGSTLALNINGATAGTGYDQVVVNGTVDISAATLAVNHGYASASGDSYMVIVNDAADAVTGTFSGISEGSKFNAAGNGTELITSYISGTGNDLALTTPIAPTITNVSSSTANGTYKIGDVITINVQFDSAVNVTGTPTLTLETGAIDRVLSYVSGTGTNTLSFSYTVQAGDSAVDLDYVSSSALSLNGGTIQDGANQAADLTLVAPGAAGSLGANQALVVDGVRPVATNITLSNTALRIDETATVTITFNERVSGLDTSDFTVANGSLNNLSSSDGGLTWTATFTPSANISNATNLITLNNTGLMDQVGNIGSGTTDSVNYAIDTQRPTASIVVTDTALKVGQTTTVTITFSEAVSGLATTDFTVPNGTLSGLLSIDGGITWTATLTPDADVTDTTNLITLDNTGVQDLAGNIGSGITDSNNYVVDTIVPVTVAMVMDKTTLNAQQTAVLTVRFSEAVTGLDVADFTVVDGVLSGLSSADGGLTWTATLTPAAGKVHSALQVTLNNAGYTDLAGNAGSNTSVSGSYAINTVLPAQPVLQVQSNAEGSAMVLVDALEAGAPWEYSLDGGQSWQAGQGNVVVIASPGLYHVQVRQTNAAGNVSQAGVLSVDVASQLVPPRVEWPVMGIFSGAGAGIWEAPLTPVGLAPLGFDADAAVLPRGSGNVFLGSGYVTGSSFFGGGVATDFRELSSGFLGDYSGVIDASAFAGVVQQKTTADRLVLLQPVDAVVAAADRQVDWKIPPTMFSHSDPLASVQFSMTLANGQPLPAWLKFDARTGQVSGVMPAGFQGELTLRLTARDSQGHAVSTLIKLKAADAETAARAGVAEQLQRQAQLRAGHMAAQRLHL